MTPGGPWHVGHVGNANTWDCDENGHLNVRHYVDRAEEAVASLFAQGGLGPQVLDDRLLTLRPAHHHMRFHAEILAGAALLARVAVVRAEPDAVDVVVELRGAGGEGLHATVIGRMTLQRLPDCGPVPFEPEQLEALRPFHLEALPEAAAPRSVSRAPAPRDWRPEDVADPRFVEIARGRVAPGECGRDQLMSPRQLVGRVSDGIVHLIAAHRGAEALADRTGGRTGGAVIEYFAEYRRPLRAGDLFTVRSALAGLRGRTQQLAHLMFDAGTSALVMAARGTAVTLDLRTRRAVSPDEATRARLESWRVDDPRLWPTPAARGD